jgi:hypothetical protein
MADPWKYIRDASARGSQVKVAACKENRTHPLFEPNMAGFRRRRFAGEIRERDFSTSASLEMTKGT